MSDSVPAALGKGTRVAGTFVLMMGAGFILDVQAVWAGVPLVVAGAVLFAWGLAVTRGGARATRTADAPAGIGEPTESHL